ncbi:hypothetical protein V8C86DRAFT_2706652, partial [Haematococcus lacustris]
MEKDISLATAGGGGEALSGPAAATPPAPGCTHPQWLAASSSTWVPGTAPTWPIRCQQCTPLPEDPPVSERGFRSQGNQDRAGPIGQAGAEGCLPCLVPSLRVRSQGRQDLSRGLDNEPVLPRSPALLPGPCSERAGLGLRPGLRCPSAPRRWRPRGCDPGCGKRVTGWATAGCRVPGGVGEVAAGRAAVSVRRGEGGGPAPGRA